MVTTFERGCKPTQRQYFFGHHTAPSSPISLGLGSRRHQPRIPQLDTTQFVPKPEEEAEEECQERENGVPGYKEEKDKQTETEQRVRSPRDIVSMRSFPDWLYQHGARHEKTSNCTVLRPYKIATREHTRELCGWNSSWVAKAKARGFVDMFRVVMVWLWTRSRSLLSA